MSNYKQIMAKQEVINSIQSKLKRVADNQGDLDKCLGDN